MPMGRRERIAEAVFLTLLAADMESAHVAGVAGDLKAAEYAKGAAKVAIAITDALIAELDK